MDAAIVAKKQGASKLTLLFEGPRETAHWHLPDAWFETDGVEVRFNVQPMGYQVDSGGAVTGVILEHGEMLETDRVIEAMGLYADPEHPEQDSVFSAGAMMNGGASVKQCMQEGKDAADAMQHFLMQKREAMK